MSKEIIPFYKKGSFWFQTACIIGVMNVAGIKGWGWDWWLFFFSMIGYGASQYSEGFDNGKRSKE